MEFADHICPIRTIFAQIKWEIKFVDGYAMPGDKIRLPFDVWAAPLALRIPAAADAARVARAHPLLRADHSQWLQLQQADDGRAHRRVARAPKLRIYFPYPFNYWKWTYRR